MNFRNLFDQNYFLNASCFINLVILKNFILDLSYLKGFQYLSDIILSK